MDNFSLTFALSFKKNKILFEVEDKSDEMDSEYLLKSLLTLMLHPIKHQ